MREQKHGAANGTEVPEQEERSSTKTGDESTDAAP
jgi:hypothetical protein